MKTKKWLFVVIVLLLIVGVGGKVFMDEKYAKKEVEIGKKKISQYKINEEEIVMDVLATYKEVKTIEFVDVGENELTGGTHYSFEINGFKGFSYYYIKNEMQGDESIVIDEIKAREVELTNREELLALKDNVKVLYGGWRK